MPLTIKLMKEEVGKFTMEKSILGHCTLTILKARREDAGLYKCKIDNTKHVTKCNVSFKGFVCSEWFLIGLVIPGLLFFVDFVPSNLIFQQ